MESSEFTDGMEFDYLMRLIKENHELKQVNIEVLRFFFVGRATNRGNQKSLYRAIEASALYVRYFVVLMRLKIVLAENLKLAKQTICSIESSY